MKRIECPEIKAEGRCLGYPYDTQLVNINGVCVHFWLGDQVDDAELRAKLLSVARNERDVVGSTYSDGQPIGFWANADMPLDVS